MLDAEVAALNALLETYPDALVVMTHRDPLSVIPSVTSLIGTLRRLNCEQVDLREARAILIEIERSGQEQQGEDHAVALSSSNQRRRSSPLLRARTRSTCAVSAASQTGSSSRSAPVQSSTA